jgi:hypothetical protein
MPSRLVTVSYPAAVKPTHQIDFGASDHFLCPFTHVYPILVIASSTFDTTVFPLVKSETL